LNIRSLKLACTSLDPSRFPRAPWIEVAVAGRSNVGKSSLLNTILGARNLARISKEPGKTQTVNFYLVNDRFYLVDLPGYGYAKVSAETRRRWKRLIFGYVAARERLGGVIQLLDSRHPPSDDDCTMLQHLIDVGRSVLVVLTKADKIPRSGRKRTLDGVRSIFSDDILLQPVTSIASSSLAAVTNISAVVPVTFFSAKTGEGRDEIWRWIERRLS
jgi:GTP-binding protein